jgi:hypothetical protein
MQETLQPWNPIYEPAPLVWEVRIYLIYLFIAGCLLITLCVNAVWKLWHISLAIQTRAEAKIEEIQRRCMRTVATLKTMAVSTIVFSGLILIDGLTRLLFAVFHERSTGYEVYVRVLLGILFIFAIGASQGTAFYIVYRLFTRALFRGQSANT